MHEFGLVASIIESVDEAAAQAGALRVIEVRLRVGVMTEAVDEALQFAWEVLSEESSLCKDARLLVQMVEPRSRCLSCGADFVHDRYHVICPQCGSYSTELIEGKDLYIDAIDIDLPDEDNPPDEADNSLVAPTDDTGSANAADAADAAGDASAADAAGAASAADAAGAANAADAASAANIPETKEASPREAAQMAK